MQGFNEIISGQKNNPSRFADGLLFVRLLIDRLDEEIFGKRVAYREFAEVVYES